MNPMIHKELYQRLRESRGWILPSAYLAVLGTVVLIAYYMDSTSSSHRKQGAELGVTIFLTLSYAQMTLLLVLAPVFSAGAITIEKEQKTLAGLLTSLLTPMEIWWGKFVSALLFLLLLIVSALPVMSLVFSFGGVGFREVALGFLSTVMVLASINAVGLYWSSLFRRSVHATAVTYIVVIILAAVTAVVAGLLSELGQYSEKYDFTKVPLWMNPYYLLTLSFMPWETFKAEWPIAALFFLLLAFVAMAQTRHNLGKAGEHS